MKRIPFIFETGIAIMTLLILTTCSKLSVNKGEDVTAPSCSLIAPNGGELWYIGTDYDLTWQASDDDSIAFFVLEYSVDEIDNWVMIGDTISGDIRDTSWTIPEIPTTIGRVRIFCQDAAGNVAGDTSNEFFTIWPQGGMIAFTSDRDGNVDIFTMWADGTHQQNITNADGYDLDACWSPDGSKIAFGSTRDGNFYEVYVMNSDGTAPVNISNNAGFNDRFPAWSPDGNKIAFSSQRAGNWEVYIMNPDGSQQYNLTANPTDDLYCSWNPAGDRLAFHSYRGNNYDIYLMDDDGSNQTRITTSSAVDIYPAWSPNGLLITFRSDIPGNNDIYLMNADGSNQTNISNDPGNDTVPRWSPDGSRIIFSSNRTGNDEIFVMGIDGTNLINISNSPSSNESHPSWSPIY